MKQQKLFLALMAEKAFGQELTISSANWVLVVRNGFWTIHTQNKISAL